MKFSSALFSLLTAILLSGCGLLDGEGEIVLPFPNQLPEIAQDFIAANYSDFSIVQIELEDICEEGIGYEVELEDGSGPDVELYFTSSGVFLFAAYDIVESALPEAIRMVIFIDFADYSTDQDDIERLELPDGSLRYAVDLDANASAGTDLEVIFNPDGSIHCQQTDNNGDDDGNNNGGDSTSVDLPTDILALINANYPGYSIESLETEDICDDLIVYEVELEDGSGPDIDLYFSTDWNLLFSSTDISQSNLPQAVLDAIAASFPSYAIESDEIERWEAPDGSLLYAVELMNGNDSGREVVFEADGTIYCQENDGSTGGNGGDSTSTQLPTDVQAFIDANYSGYTIESVETEDYCDDLPAIEVELEDGPGADTDLYFSTDWVFLFAETEISSSGLPNAILTAIADNYSEFEIDADKIRRWNWADGSQTYSVELESDDNDDTKLVFNADGSVYCIE